MFVQSTILASANSSSAVCTAWRRHHQPPCSQLRHVPGQCLTAPGSHRRTPIGARWCGIRQLSPGYVVFRDAAIFTRTCQAMMVRSTHRVCCLRWGERADLCSPLLVKWVMTRLTASTGPRSTAAGVRPADRYRSSRISHHAMVDVPPSLRETYTPGLSLTSMWVRGSRRDEARRHAADRVWEPS